METSRSGRLWHIACIHNPGDPLLQTLRVWSVTGSWILIADRDELNAGEMARVVRGLGYRVQMKRDIDAVMQFLQRCPVKMLILDTSIFGLEGAGALERLKLLQPGAPVVVTTATPSDEMEREIRSHGVIYYTPKPVNLFSIQEIVNRSTGRGLIRGGRA